MQWSETKWDVPAIVAGVPQRREWDRLYSGSRRPPPNELEVDNTRGTTTLTFIGNRGETRRCHAGMTITVFAEDVGPFTDYQIDADLNVEVGRVAVYERYPEV